MGHKSVAIDGPSGAGKSTLARQMAQVLGFLYVDTGAIYRTLGLPTRTGVDKNKVLSYMQHDKKSAGSTITVIKVPGLGCWRADKIPMTELPALLGIKENED